MLYYVYRLQNYHPLLREQELKEFQKVIRYPRQRQHLSFKQHLLKNVHPLYESNRFLYKLLLFSSMIYIQEFGYAVQLLSTHKKNQKKKKRQEYENSLF